MPNLGCSCWVGPAVRSRGSRRPGACPCSFVSKRSSSVSFSFAFRGHARVPIFLIDRIPLGGVSSTRVGSSSFPSRPSPLPSFSHEIPVDVYSPSQASCSRFVVAFPVSDALFLGHVLGKFPALPLPALSWWWRRLSEQLSRQHLLLALAPEPTHVDGTQASPWHALPRRHDAFERNAPGHVHPKRGIDGASLFIEIFPRKVSIPPDRGRDGRHRIPPSIPLRDIEISRWISIPPPPMGGGRRHPVGFVLVPLGFGSRFFPFQIRPIEPGSDRVRSRVLPRLLGRHSSFVRRDRIAMPAGHGSRARTRDTFSRGFRQKGVIPVSTYLRTFKIGDYVDIKVNSAVHKVRRETEGDGDLAQTCERARAMGREGEARRSEARGRRGFEGSRQGKPRRTRERGRPPPQMDGTRVSFARSRHVRAIPRGVSNGGRGAARSLRKSRWGTSG